MPDIKQKILFQMGAVGTTGATRSIGSMALKFTAVTAAAGLAINKLNDMYDSAVKFDSLVKNLNIDMSEFNQRTNGLVDTTASLEAAIKLQNAGLNVSKEQMAAIGVAAAKMNQDLGDTPEGATTQFNKLVKSVIMGTERGLIPFGIELSQTEDKAKASAEAMDALVEKFSGVSVKAETAKERMFALKNSLGTVIDAEFNGFLDDMSDAFDDLALSVLDNSDALLKYEEDLIATEGQLARNFSVMTDLDSVAAAYNETVIAGIEAGESNWIIQGRLIQQNEHMSDSTLDNARAYIAERDAILESIEAKKESEAFDAAMIERRRAAAVQGSDVDKLRAAEDAMRQASSIAELEASYRTALGLVRGGNVGPFNEFDVADVYRRSRNRVQASIRIAEQVSPRGGRGAEQPVKPTEKELLDLGPFVRGDGTIEKDTTVTDMFGARKAEGPKQGITGAILDPSVLEDIKTTEQIIADTRQEIKDEADAEARRKEEEHQQEMLKIREASMTASADLLGAASTLANKNNEEGFKIYQATAFSENAISTIQGASGAFNRAVETLPPGIGHAVGIASAAAVTLRGVAAGRDILSQKPTSRTSPSNTRGGAFPSGGSGVGGGDNNDTFNIAVVLNGATIQQDSIRQNQMEKQAGNPHFVMSDG